jgi:hypothetical protein
MPEIAETKAGWFERVFGSWKAPTLRYASAALILLLAISTAWLFYDARKTRNELAMARNSLANSESVLNDRLAEKENQLNEKLAEQRGESSESLSELQSEIESLRKQIEDAKRKSANANVSVPTSPTIATILLPVARGGMNAVPTIAIAKETKVLNVKIPLAADDGDTFDLTVSHDGRLVLKSASVKATQNANGKILMLALSSRPIAPGKYDVVLKDNGSEKTRSFIVAVK